MLNPHLSKENSTSATSNEYYNSYYKLKRGDVSNWKIPIQSIVNQQKQSEPRQFTDLTESIMQNTKKNFDYAQYETGLLKNFQRSLHCQFSNTALKESGAKSNAA